MAKEFKRYLVTSALPYANGPVHIGHLAGVYIPSDIYTRYLRRRGRDVLSICGSDEHGVAITIKARKEGVSPKEIIDRYPQPHQAFVRTARHVVRHLFAHLVARPCPNGVGFLPQALRRGQVRREDLRAVLRRGGAAVSGRPLHRGHLSPLPERKGLRRPVREVRVDAFARRTDRTPQRVVRFAARQARDQEHAI